MVELNEIQRGIKDRDFVNAAPERARRTEGIIPDPVARRILAISSLLEKRLRYSPKALPREERGIGRSAIIGGSVVDRVADAIKQNKIKK